MSASRFLAQYALTPASVRKAVGADTAKLTFDSILTYPVHDMAGDYVEPAGCDFTPHMADAVIDLEHRRHPLVKGAPVAWARASFEKPDAPYSVRMVEFDFGEPGRVAVPVGTEFYKASDRLSMQIFAMREQDALPASSLEFEMVPGHFQEIGYSDLEKRAAYRFSKCLVHRWTVCERGVNPGALTLTKSRTQVPEALAKILTDKRIHMGDRSEPLHEDILKALAPEIEALEAIDTTRRAYFDGRDTLKGSLVVRVEKGVETSDLTTQNEEATQAGTEGTATPTAQAAYDLAQGAHDLCEQIKARMAQGEHKSGRKKLQALCEKLDTVSEMALSVGKSVDADLADGEEPAAEASDMEAGEDGMLKGIPTVYRKAVKRFKLADLPAPAPEREQKAEPPAPPPEPAVPAALEAKLARLERILDFI